MAAPETVVSKGDFARICNVSPGRVTQWIQEGKISGAALVGEGRSARIIVGAAQKQLRARLDSGQAFGNGLNTKLRGPEPTPAAPPRADPPDTDADPANLADDALDEQIKRERLEALQRANRKAAEEEAAAQGRYTSAAAAKRQLIMIAAQAMRIFEGALPEIASAIAATVKVEERDVLLVLNAQFRKVREQAAQTHKRTAEQLPALVGDHPQDAEA